jgi:hypothetical protein
VGLFVQYCGSVRFFMPADCTDLDAELFHLTVWTSNSWSTALWLHCHRPLTYLTCICHIEMSLKNPWNLDGINVCCTLCNNSFPLLAFVYKAKLGLVDFLNGDHVIVSEQIKEM